jgi:putative transposase
LGFYRIYRELALNLQIKPRHRLVREQALPLALPIAINQSWSMDFMHAQLVDGRSIRLFNVIDEFNRKGSGFHVIRPETCPCRLSSAFSLL